jgi:hypothetical protein
LIAITRFVACKSDTDATGSPSAFSSTYGISVDWTDDKIQEVIGGSQGLGTASRALSAFGGFFSAHPHPNIVVAHTSLLRHQHH